MKVNIYYTEDNFIPIPFSLDSIDYEQFIDFKAKDYLYREASKIKTPFDEDLEACEDKETTKIVKEQISNWIKDNVTNTMHEDYYNKSVNALYDTLCIIYPEEALADIPPSDSDKVSGNFIYSIDSLFEAKITWIHLYLHFINLVDSFEPKKLESKFSIDWKGKTYVINAQKATNLLIDTAFTGGEVLTLLEFRRRRLRDIKATGDIEGNLEFSLGIHEMAILLREEGHVLPTNRAELINYVDRQGDIFKRLPLSIVLTVRFFLIFIMKVYIKTQIINTFSTLQNGKEKLKSKEKQLEIVKLKISQFGMSLDGREYTKWQLKENGLKLKENLIMNQYF